MYLFQIWNGILVWHAVSFAWSKANICYDVLCPIACWYGCIFVSFCILSMHKLYRYINKCLLFIVGTGVCDLCLIIVLYLLWWINRKLGGGGTNNIMSAKCVWRCREKADVNSSRCFGFWAQIWSWQQKSKQVGRATCSVVYFLIKLQVKLKQIKWQ